MIRTLPGTPREMPGHSYAAVQAITTAAADEHDFAGWLAAMGAHAAPGTGGGFGGSLRRAASRLDAPRASAWARPVVRRAPVRGQPVHALRRRAYRRRAGRRAGRRSPEDRVMSASDGRRAQDRQVNKISRNIFLA